MHSAFRLAHLIVLLLAYAGPAGAAVGLAELGTNPESGPVTIFYPTASEPAVERRGPFTMNVAVDAPLGSVNRRLIVISHGSPASPWVHFDLASSLVNAGFVVALPEHFGDNDKDSSDPGPPSWRRRPMEVTRAIDRVRAEPRFGPALDFGRIGMFGMSAGGHTALTLAGGRWSPSRLRRHCNQHTEEDFHTCAGPFLFLTGGMFDGIKLMLVRNVNNMKFNDPSWYEHSDPRIAAIVAGVPFAVDFDPGSLKNPRPALAIVSARKDKWLSPRFHSDAVLQACRSCEHLADLPTGGHGALLSPLPPGRSAAVEALVGDPPDFDRNAIVPRVNEQIAAFFKRHLLDGVK